MNDENVMSNQDPNDWPTCDKSTMIDSAKAGSCGLSQAQEVLDSHNALRSRYGSAPLLWSSTLSDVAESILDGGELKTSPSQFGEIFSVGRGIDCRSAVALWLKDEINWKTGASNGAFIQMVAKNSVQVGCAVRSVGDIKFVACAYHPAGNKVADIDSNVLPEGSKPECEAAIAPSEPGAACPSKSQSTEMDASSIQPSQAFASWILSLPVSTSNSTSCCDENLSVCWMCSTKA